MGKRVGVVLAGCGVKDGTELHEAVLTLWALDRAGAEVICVAPEGPQRDVVDHVSGLEQAAETRNLLKESARIARGNIRAMAGIGGDDLDGLVFPGGYGAAKNLCDFAYQGQNCTVEKETERLIRELHAAGKPLGFICIAPVIAARVLGSHRPLLTIGNDPQVAAAMEAMGAQHVPCRVDEVVVDVTNRVVSTPAYMLASRITEVAVGVEKLVGRLLALTGT